MSGQLIDTEGSPCVANNGSTNDLRRKSLGLIAIFSSLFPKFIVSLEDLCADFNCFFHKHGLDSSVFCSLFVCKGRVGRYEDRPQRDSDLRPVSRHNQCDHRFDYILSPNTNNLASTDAFSTKSGHSCYLCDRIVVNMSVSNNFHLLTPNSGIAAGLIGLFNRVTLFQDADIGYTTFIIALCRSVVSF